MISTLIIRNREEGDVLAPELMKSLEVMDANLDPNWQWVAEYDGRIVGQILAAPAHGILMLLRITATPDCPKSWAVLALRKVLKDARERGCLGFMAFLDDRMPQEVKLMRIVQRAGGMVLPAYGAWVAGSTETDY